VAAGELDVFTWEIDGEDYNIKKWWLFDELADSYEAREDSLNTNPKAAHGIKSLPVSLLSPLAIVLGSLGKLNGKLKYGGANYIGTEVVASIYIEAILRHIFKYLLGEDVDEVDKVPHLGAIIADCDILASAAAAGTLIDDRLRCDGQLEAIKALMPLVQSLQELHKDKNPKHYYMKDK
jgi:hypothetical protein